MNEARDRDEARHAAFPNGRPKMVATYDYADEAGAPLYQVVRYEPGFEGEDKTFRQRRPDGRGGWVKGLGDVRRVLYRLHDLAQAPLDRPVYVVEGEKDVENLRAVGVLATTNAMGAGKWLPAYTDLLRGRHVIVLSDNDDAGRAHARQVAQALAGVAASVATVELPGLAPKGDVSDWLAAGGDKEQLLQLVADAARSAPPTEHATSAMGQQGSVVFTNFKEEEAQVGDRRVAVKVGLSVKVIQDELLRLTGGWPKRVGELLFAEGGEHQPLWLASADALFGWVAGRLPNEGVNPVQWAGGSGKVSEAQFFAYLRQAAKSFDAVEAFPHHPPLPRHFYLHPKVKGGDGKALRDFLRRFQPATAVDYDLIRALALTLFWGGRMDSGRRF